MSQDVLLRELEAELRSGPPDPPPSVESAEAKRSRLLLLDDELRPGAERWNTSMAMVWVHGLGGRICDLPEHLLDVIALRVPRTAEMRRAYEQVNRGRC